MPTLSARQRRPATVSPAETPGLSSLLSLAVAVVVVAALYFAREVLIPITVAVLLSFVLAPLVGAFQRLRAPHTAAVALAVVLALGVVLTIGSVIGVQVAGIATDVPRYADTIHHKIDSVREMTLGRLTAVTNRLDLQLGRRAPAPPASPQAAAEASAPKPQVVAVEPPQTSPVEIARAILAPVVDPLSNLFIVLIVTVFILMQREDLRDRLIRLFGSSDLHRTTLAMDDAARRLGRYFLAQLAINASFGVVAALGLAAIGVPSPALWGVTSALLRFVPYIGAVIAALLPAALAAAVDPGWAMVLWTIALYVIAESVTGQVLEPLIYGHSTGLSPAAIVIAAIFWTWVWGPVGLVLSTPLTLCLVVLGRHVDRLEFFDVLLGDRPALTPIENFYQRMLADDPDEALHQAELMLKDRSLTAYYDEVALKGLQLAANDALRGALAPERVEHIKDNVRALIQDLDAFEDQDPHPDDRKEAEAVATRAERAVPKPPAPRADALPAEERAPEWRAEAPILCLAGRGPLDEAVAAMLAQLLGKHGLGARVAPHHAATRAGMNELETGGVAMVCVSYLELGGNPAKIHYLVRRLRRHLPHARILLGLWPVDSGEMQDQRMRHAVGADDYVSSLRDAVDLCVTAANAGGTTSSTAAGARPEQATELPLSPSGADAAALA